MIIIQDSFFQDRFLIGKERIELIKEEERKRKKKKAFLPEEESFLKTEGERRKEDW